MESPDQQTNEQSTFDIDHVEDLVQDNYDDLTARSSQDINAEKILGRSTIFGSGSTLHQSPAGRLVLLAGGAAFLGLFAINRYARCPVRRRYGRLGLGVAFSAFSYDRIMQEDLFQTMDKQFEDEHLNALWVVWTTYFNSQKPMMVFDEEPLKTFLCNFYERKRYTEEDKRHIREEGIRDFYISRRARALAHMLQRANFESRGVSPRDIHHCTSFFAAALEGDRIDKIQAAGFNIGLIAGLVGILVPWRILIPPLFLLSSTGMFQYCFFGAYRMQSFMYHIGSLRDKALIVESMSYPAAPVDPAFRKAWDRANASLPKPKAERNTESQAPAQSA